MCWVMPPVSLSTTFGATDLVEQRGLAVVDVPEDRDDGRTEEEAFLVFVVAFQVREELVLGGMGIDDLEFDAVLHGEFHGRLVFERRVDVDGGPDREHQLAQKVIGLDTDCLGEGPHGDRRLDLGMALPGDVGLTAPALLTARATIAPGIILTFEQGRSRHWRGDRTTFGGTRGPLVATAGAVGRGSQPVVALTLAIVLILSAGRSDGGRRGGTRVRRRGWEVFAGSGRRGGSPGPRRACRAWAAHRHSTGRYGPFREVEPA